jgi:hypothetical protein
MVRHDAGKVAEAAGGIKMLNVGESAQATIEAKKKWNDTGIELARGHEYHFTATGQWTDWRIACDANGYANPNVIFKVLERFRRSPRSRWFALIGALNADEHTQFEIGTERTLIAPASGTLTCFANDGARAYWNNLGSVRLSVTRTR